MDIFKNRSEVVFNEVIRCSEFQVVSDQNMNENISWNLHRHSKDAKLAEKYVNLKIQLQWSEWSSCEQGTTVRTREGDSFSIS